MNSFSEGLGLGPGAGRGRPQQRAKGEGARGGRARGGRERGAMAPRGIVAGARRGASRTRGGDQSDFVEAWMKKVDRWCDRNPNGSMVVSAGVVLALLWLVWLAASSAFAKISG